MATQTKKVFAIATLVVVSLGTAAQAGTLFPTDEAGYARWRIDAAFNVAAQMPVVAAVSVPMAMKGDLPVPLGCADAKGDTQAECMDVAYEPDATPSMVVETRIGSTSILTRMDAFAVAGVSAKSLQQAE